MDLSFSLINHSNPRLLYECIKSIYGSIGDLEFEIWVVDNATGGRGLEKVKSSYPQVKWIINDEVKGFSANNNQIFAVAAGRYVCVLNDDTVLCDRAIEKLVTYIDSEPRVGIVAPRLLNIDGSTQVSVFKAPTLFSELIDLVYLPAILSKLKWIGIDKDALLSASPQSVDWALGACLVVRREVIQDVGGFDDKLFPIVNREDTEWCDRVRRAGWDIVYEPSAEVIHYYGSSKHDGTHGKLSPVIARAAHLARADYYVSKHGWIGKFAYKIVYGIGVAWNMCMLLQASVRGKRTLRDAWNDFERQIVHLFAWSNIRNSR